MGTGNEEPTQRDWQLFCQKLIGNEQCGSMIPTGLLSRRSSDHKILHQLHWLQPNVTSFSHTYVAVWMQQQLLHFIYISCIISLNEKASTDAKLSYRTDLHVVVSRPSYVNLSWKSLCTTSLRQANHLFTKAGRLVTAMANDDLEIGSRILLKSVVLLSRGHE